VLATDKGITLKGNITHYDEGFDNQYNGLGLIREPYIGDYLYTISDEIIKINNINGLAQITEIKLP
jgi:hypothetical protein